MNHFLPRAAVTAACIMGLVAAQSTGLRTHYRLASAVLGQSSSTNYLNHDSGWVAGPALLSVDANGNQFGGCFANGLCNAYASYGELRVLATGNASSCAISGMALALDEWSGGMPKAQFLDVLTVQSATLPLGAPVQIDMALDFTGNAGATGTSPYTTISARLLVGGTPVLAAAGPGYSTAVLSTTVGAMLPINGQLRVTLGDNALLGGSSYFADLRAHYVITPTTAGVTLAAMSAATYGDLLARALPFGAGCGAVPPALAATPPQLGTVCTLAVSGAPSNAAVLLGLSIGGASPVEVGPCTLYLDRNTAQITLAGISSSAGQLLHNLTIPPVAGLAGLWITSQAAPLTANGVFLGVAELSNGLTLTLGS